MLSLGLGNKKGGIELRRSIRSGITAFIAGLQFPVLLLAAADAVSAQTLSPRDFSAAADRVGFDDLTSQSPVTYQLTMAGLYPLCPDNSPVQLVDSRNMEGSALYAISTSSPDPALPLEILFSQPRSKVGFHFGVVAAIRKAVLTAYDDSGREVGKSTTAVFTGARKAFIGVGAASQTIERVVLSYDSPAAKIIDDLLVEPGQEASVDDGAVRMLGSSTATSEAKLLAIDALQKAPSKGASAALQQAARSEADLYVRERAVMALAQICDRAAIPTLVAIGETPPNYTLRQAAEAAVFRLRRVFPMDDPPKVTFRTAGDISPGKEFTVEAEVVSPVARDNVRISFTRSDQLQFVRDDRPVRYKGPLLPNRPVVVAARLRAAKLGQVQQNLSVRISLNQIDATTYRVPLFIDVKEAGGTASEMPFPGWDQLVRHRLPLKPR